MAPRASAPSLLALVGALLAGVVARPARAQEPAESSNDVARAAAAARRVTLPTPRLGTTTEDRARLAQLRDSAPTSGYLLRSLSSRLAMSGGSSVDSLRAWALVPELTFVDNSMLPFSMNDGALWAGRGTNVRLTAGLAATWGPLRLVLMPELISSANAKYTTIDSATYWAPALDPKFSPYASPWNQYPYPIDLPTRFGDERIRRLDWGQSALWAEAGPVAAGVATENEWWGPGIRNALLLSNNAGGFPHAFVRTSHPIRTRVGSFEGRWIVGALGESAFYDSIPGNDRRSLSAAAITWTPPRASGLTLGLERMVIAPASNGAQPYLRWFDVLANTGRPDAVWMGNRKFPMADSATRPGRDQLIALFGRYVMPASGFEVYAEVGRAEMPKSLRDFLIDPAHSIGYTGGFQYLRPVPRASGAVRLQGEFTYLEQSPSYRRRAIGSWYTSLAVRQGFTQEGQTLGAAIGPGSSSQYVAADFLAPAWGAGLYVGRWRWNNDADMLMPFPFGSGWCEHDVTFSPGVRGHAGRAGWGLVTLDVAFPLRDNMFFQNKSGCPHGAFMRDVRGRSVSITVQPFAGVAGRVTLPPPHVPVVPAAATRAVPAAP